MVQWYNGTTEEGGREGRRARQKTQDTRRKRYKGSMVQRYKAGGGS